MLNRRIVVQTLARIFADEHAGNLTAGGDAGHYGFEVVNLSDDLSTFDLVATFKAGQVYCCLEWGCHFRLRADDWRSIRARVDAAGLQSLPPLTIRNLRCVVERGALWELEGKTHVADSYVYSVGPFVEGVGPRQCSCKRLLVEGETGACPGCGRPIHGS
jgi:hypothetical protein